MAPAQSSLIPPPGTKPRLGDAGWLIAFGLRGLIELIRARVAFDRLEPRAILARNQQVAAAACTDPASVSPALAARIGYVIPRISARLPWRSDCVIQAMAAQRWLATHGLASEIQIGVERPEGAPFGAHAWLVHHGAVVTGGDIARYDLLVGESPLTAAAAATQTGAAAPQKRS
jgi:Transglutaminase-like superfamily